MQEGSQLNPQHLHLFKMEDLEGAGDRSHSQAEWPVLDQMHQFQLPLSLENGAITLCFLVYESI